MSTYTVREIEEFWQKFAEQGSNLQIGSIFIRGMPPWDKLCDELRWNTLALDGSFWSQGRYSRPGVYRIIGLQKPGRVDLPIIVPRAFAQDKTGTLYVGKTNNLLARYGNMRRPLRRPRQEHGAIALMSAAPLLADLRGRLAISLYYSECPPKYVESELFKAYINSFGDTPPLNLRIDGLNVL